MFLLKPLGVEITVIKCIFQEYSYVLEGASEITLGVRNIVHIPERVK